MLVTASPWVVPSQALFPKDLLLIVLMSRRRRLVWAGGCEVTLRKLPFWPFTTPLSNALSNEAIRCVMATLALRGRLKIRGSTSMDNRLILNRRLFDAAGHCWLLGKYLTSSMSPCHGEAHGHSVGQKRREAPTIKNLHFFP